MKIHLLAAVSILVLGSTLAFGEKLPIPPSSLPKEMQTTGTPLKTALQPTSPLTLGAIDTDIPATQLLEIAQQPVQDSAIFTRSARENNAAVISYDLNCSGRVNANYIVPDRKTDAIMLNLDRNGDGRPDVLFFDFKRRGKWDLSFWDAKFEGRWTLVGYHDDGSLRPTRFERYEDFQQRLAAQH